MCVSRGLTSTCSVLGERSVLNVLSHEPGLLVRCLSCRGELRAARCSVCSQHLFLWQFQTTGTLHDHALQLDVLALARRWEDRLRLLGLLVLGAVQAVGCEIVDCRLVLSRRVLIWCPTPPSVSASGCQFHCVSRQSVSLCSTKAYGACLSYRGHHNIGYMHLHTSNYHH